MAEIVNGEPAATDMQEYMTSDQAATALNTTHRTSDGKNHSDVVSNNAHQVSDGSDHSKVTANETAIGLNTTHRGNTGSDHSLAADAIHDNVAGEIAAITEKASPASSDLAIIEDSADNNKKKKVQVGNLPGASAGFASYCSVYLSGQQTLTTATDTKITFDSESWDNNNEFDAITNNRFVAKIAGVYHVSAQLMYLMVTIGKVVQCKIKVDGTVVKIRSVCHYGGVNEYVGVVGDVKLAIGEYIEIWGEHNEGSNLNLNNNVIASFLDIHRIA